MTLRYLMMRIQSSRLYHELASLCELVLFVAFCIFIYKIFVQYAVSVLVGGMP